MKIKWQCENNKPIEKELDVFDMREIKHCLSSEDFENIIIEEAVSSNENG